jgi:Cytoskeletal-regulatory complex EF hand
MPQPLLADKDGKITGQEAKEMFPRSRLPQHRLATIWALCDDRKKGALGFDDFVKAMELISLAQAGREVTEKEWLLQQKVHIALCTSCMQGDLCSSVAMRLCPQHGGLYKCAWQCECMHV